MTKNQSLNSNKIRPSKKLCGLLLLFCLVCVHAFAQEVKTIEGTIRAAADGIPLFGVNIVVKGTTIGAVSDFDGNYSIQAGSNAVLVISYLGFETQEISVDGQTTVDVSLVEDSAKLDEVVVVGYGSQKRSDISGSVSQIEQKEIAKNPTPNLSNALVGQAPGIIATQRSGEPGRDGSNIFIRGIGTTGDASPIYVIDGIVRSSRDFSQLNANEIESFAILFIRKTTFKSLEMAVVRILTLMRIGIQC